MDIDILHCHFTTIEYGNGGEVKKHHTLAESNEYGPNIEDLLSNLIDNGWRANIICETPLRDEDALKMKRALRNHDLNLFFLNFNITNSESVPHLIGSVH